MRRTLLTLASLAALALIPAGALAQSHHHARHHSRKHHARVRIERFGQMRSGSSTASSPAETAGTVQSFDGTTLVIAIGDHSVSGRVTPDTEIECAAMSTDSTIHEDGDGGGSDTEDAAEPTTGSGDQGDDDAGETGDADEQNASCSTTSLVTGATVRGAELRISSAGAVWKKVELG